MTPCLGVSGSRRFEKLLAHHLQRSIFLYCQTLKLKARRPFDKSEATHPTRRHFPEDRSTHPPTMMTSSIKPHQIQVMRPKTSHKTTLQYASFSPYFVPKTEFPDTRQKSSTAVRQLALYTHSEETFRIKRR